MPDTRLGLLDLVYEFSRRIACAYELPDLTLIGHSLSDGPGQPLVPLPQVNVTALSKGVSQDLADRIMHALHEQCPDILYELGEQQRRMIRLNEIEGQLMEYRHHNFDRQFSISAQAVSGVNAHVFLCIYLMTGLPLPAHLMVKMNSQSTLESDYFMPSLQVLQESRCDQKTVDDAIQFLERHRPDLINSIATEIENGREGNSLYNKSINQAVDFLKAEGSGKFFHPSTRLGWLDLMFELSRRIAKANGLADLELVGRPTAKMLAEITKVWGARSSLREEHGITHELADRVISLLQERSPHVLNEMAEQKRRVINIAEIDKELWKALTSLEGEGVPSGSLAKIRLKQEINTRLGASS